MRGSVIAFEGLDQSGKQTQSERLADVLRSEGRQVEFLSFPAYATSVGAEIGLALQGARDYDAATLQLLYIANRYEFRPRVLEWLAAGAVVICDRYLASSIAYGEAQGLDAAWLADVQRFLPAPALTIVLDIPPEVSLQRKGAGRDRFEQDLPLLSRVRASYRRQAEAPDWLLIDGQQDVSVVADAIMRAVRSRLATR
ncbi:MAG TPA: dTMP kinase [Vicinamibacterales bacterium]|jgi:dTMP kinase|nr:dTMP kinase [Vicinamibacterales bacterium]